MEDKISDLLLPVVLKMKVKFQSSGVLVNRMFHVQLEGSIDHLRFYWPTY
jgi:hypothetical protein